MVRSAGWRVTLGGGAGVGTPAEITDAAAGITVASVGGVPIGGQWGAAFHGCGNAVLTDQTPHPATRRSTWAGVAGWFDAAGDSVSPAGAFASYYAQGDVVHPTVAGHFDIVEGHVDAAECGGANRNQTVHRREHHASPSPRGPVRRPRPCRTSCSCRKETPDR